MLGDPSPEIVLTHTDYLTIIINSLQSVLAQGIHHRLDQRCGMDEQPQALLCRCLALKLFAASAIPYQALMMRHGLSNLSVSASLPLAGEYTAA